MSGAQDSPAAAPPGPGGAQRRVRSFVRREGRITPAQRAALAGLAHRHGLELTNTIVDLDQAFGRRAPRWLEIGAGNGECTAALAAAHPENDLLAVEVHGPGVGHLLNLVERRGLCNVRVVRTDATELLSRLPHAAFEAVLVFFPDPWPKKRHHKRRLVQVGFLRALAPLLARHGRVFLATDDAHYAAAMREAAEAAGYRNLAPGGYAPRPAWRPVTRFEARARRLGHTVYELMLAAPA